VNIPTGLIGGRYQLLDKLGFGGMGIVYRALDKSTGQQVALKQVILSADQKPQDAEEMRLALAHEFQTLASLRHPHIISVLDYGFDAAHQPYFSMDLLVQPQSILAAGRSRSLAGKIDLLVQTLQALVYLHRRSILHRDLKPGNVQVVDSQVKVLDFGLSIKPAMPVPEDGVVGTPAYMAPEVLQGEPATEASDLYAMGVIAYELLADRHPFDTSKLSRLVSEVMSKAPDLNLLATRLRAAESPVTPPDTLPEMDSAEPADGSTTRIIPSVDAVDQTTRGSPQDVDQDRDQTTRPSLPAPSTTHTTRPSVPIMGSTPAPSTGPAGQAAHPVVAVVQKLLAKDPRQRYDDASVVIRDLSAAIGEPLPVETVATRESFLQAAQFVGREAEMGQLTDALNEALAGRGSAWLIGGESGVGKSRLLDELRTRALVAGALVLRGQAVSEAGGPHQVWRDPLRRLALIADLSDADASILKTLIPDIGDLLERPIPDAPELDPERPQKLLASLVASIFHRQTQAAVLILEDLHWAGSESWSVLNHLCLSGRDLPLLILGSFRDDERPDLPETLPGMRVMKLDRLDDADIAALSESMLGQAGRQATVLNLLQRETEGNVFFLVEVVRALAEEAGQLGSVGTMTLPAQVFAGGVQRIVERRLGRVPADAYPLLQIAAVIGRQLDLAVLRAADPDRNLDPWLAACADAAVLEVRDERWQFAHDKLREGVLAALLPDARPALHRRAALAFEAARPDQVAALAYHWGAAGDTAKEAHYAALAGDQADRVSAYQDAIAYFNRALAVLDKSPETQAQRAALMAHLGRVYVRVSAYDQANRLLQDSITLATAMGEHQVVAEALCCLGNASRTQGAQADAVRYYTDGLAASRQIGDGRCAAEALRGLARIARSQGQYAEAVRQAEESLTVSRKMGDRWRMAYALAELAVIATVQGEHAAAVSRLQESLAIFREIGDRRGMADALTNLGQVMYNQGSPAQAIRHFEESLAISRETGDRWGVAATLNDLGYIAVMQGNYAQAGTYLEDALALFREIGDRTAVAQTLTNLGHVASALGDDASAASRFHEALQMALAMDAVPLALEIVAGVARLRARAGHTDQALELAGLTLNHPGCNTDVRGHAAPLVDELRARLPPPVVEAALERGKARDLNSVAAEILKSHSRDKS
jgi:serine/threonine protein kinase/tetratricopeptide (TPR) repeat protein